MMKTAWTAAMALLMAGMGAVQSPAAGYTLLDLSGGTGGTYGQTVYTAPNGTVLTSSAPTYNWWDHIESYRIGNLFDGYMANELTDSYAYWMTASTGNQTLTFAFDQVYRAGYVRVYPHTRDDSRSDFKVSVSVDGSTYTDMSGWIDTAGDTWTSYHDISVEQNIRYLRFELTRIGKWGVSLAEVKVYLRTDTADVLTLDSGDRLTLNAGETLSSDLMVPADATIAGAGTLAGEANVYGTLDVGETADTAATLGFGGGFTLHTGSVTRVDLFTNGVAGVDYDRIEGSGTAIVLDGMLVAVMPIGYAPPVSAVFNVIHDDAGLSGSFTNVVKSRVTPFRPDGSPDGGAFRYALIDTVMLSLSYYGNPPIQMGSVFIFR